MAQYTYDDSEIKKVIDNLNKLQMRDIANLAKNKYQENFNLQGYKDKFLVPWKKSYKKEGNTLIKSGDLRRSIHTEAVTEEEFTISSNLEYSEIHNEGGKIKKTDNLIKYIKFKIYKNKYNTEEIEKWSKMLNKLNTDGYLEIPKRKYMGESQYIVDEILNYIKKYF